MREAQSLSLSILVPVYNEQYLAVPALERLEMLEKSEILSRVEVIVVDDGSTDRTADLLAAFQQGRAQSRDGSKLSWQFVRHDRNYGKGRAIRTALERATGEVAVVYDADLEYHPRDLERIAKVFLEEEVDAVFGSRFAGGQVRRALMYRHQMANTFLTFLCNLVSNLNLTDVWTCYKAVRTPLLKSIPIVSNDFRIEPELAIKLARRDARIFEVPISYAGRTYAEGKKIGLKDAFLALYAIIGFGLSDQLYTADEYGSHVLHRLSRATRFNRWMADTIRPFCGERVLEIGSGVGNLTRSLIPRAEYVASDINPLYLQTLENLKDGRPYLSVAYCDVSDLQSFPKAGEGYDTVICLNVIEHVADDKAALLNIKSVLRPGGRAIILVPQGLWNFGTLDKALGHQRRYTAESLDRLARQCALRISHLLQFNRIGSVAWYLNGKILRRRSFGLAQVWLLNLVTPLMRALDSVAPLPPLSLIAVMEPAQVAADASVTQASAHAAGRVGEALQAHS
jgi:SAM-dependent methyltransferase